MEAVSFVSIPFPKYSLIFIVFLALYLKCF